MRCSAQDQFPPNEGRHPVASFDDLIPVRALNQVTYCPRLYFLQYVDCVMPTNEHVEAGLHDHRRVDDEGLANRPRKDGAVVRTRGVSLAAEARGVGGGLARLEEAAGQAGPGA